MSKKNRSVSEKSLESASGGVITPVYTTNNDIFYKLFDDSGEYVATYDSLDKAKEAAKRLGMSDKVIYGEQVIDNDGLISSDIAEDAYKV